MTARLIVTADDVGLHEATTLGAIAASERGIVTACSVVATGAAFEHAVALLKAHPRLAVGVHLTLVEGRPLLPPSDVPSLVTPAGRFPESHRSFVGRYLARRIALDHVERELRAQIEKVNASGLTVSHLNSHQHVHVLPGIFDLVLTIAAEYGIGYVRVPLDRSPSQHARLARMPALAVLRIMALRAQRRAQRRPTVTTNDCTLGIAAAGHVDRARLLELLPLAQGLTELVTHPGLDDETLRSIFPWDYEWQAELDALCDDSVKQACSERGFLLVRPVEGPQGMARA